MENKIYKDLIKLCKKCLNSGDVPAAAIIVKNDEIISKGINKRVKSNKSIDHAEISAILKANKKLKSYFLYDCDLYVTLKPCEMCEKVINSARIRRVYYLVDKPITKKEYSKVEYIKIENDEGIEYQKIMSDFFNNLRN